MPVRDDHNNGDDDHNDDDDDDDNDKNVDDDDHHDHHNHDDNLFKSCFVLFIFFSGLLFPKIEHRKVDWNWQIQVRL